MANRSYSIAFRVTLFMVGFAVLLLALFLLLPFSLGGMGARLFTVVDAVGLYVLAFAPFTLPWRISDLTGGRIVSLGIYGRAVSLYAILTFVVLVFANTSMYPPMRLLIIVQLLGVVGLLLALYFANATSEHVEEVAQVELGQRLSVDRVRVAAERLDTRVAGIDRSRSSAHDELAREAARIADDIRYLAPSNEYDAQRLDSQIESEVLVLCDQTGRGDLTTEDAAKACVLARDITALVAERKLHRSQ